MNFSDHVEEIMVYKDFAMLEFIRRLVWRLFLVWRSIQSEVSVHVFGSSEAGVRQL
jgi:hypothetical protein